MTKKQATTRLLYVLSPAKTLDMSAPTVSAHSLPVMLSDARVLVTELRKLAPAQLKKLLSVSDAIAKLNHDRFKAFEFVEGKASVPPSSIHKQAVLAFNGPAYQGLEANELSPEQLQYANDHLRILCGLYGVLRPLDLIQAYRLEMGQKFANPRGKDLYAFWGDSIAKAINAGFGTAAEKVLVNVASQEYFKSVALDALDEDVKVVDCVFKDDGAIKSVYAKRARGLMCRYLIVNKVDSIEGIKQFDLEGYAFSAKESNATTLVFNRTAAKQKEVLKLIQAKAKRLKEERVATAEEAVEAAPVKTKRSTKSIAVKKEPEEAQEGVRRSTRKRQRVE